MMTLMKTTKYIQKGFTLIELLVVIGILSILVVGLMVAINPQDKLNAASDSKVISAAGAIARAAEAFATSSSNGAYPPTTSYNAFVGNTTTTGTLVGNGELKTAPVVPNSNYTYQITADGTGFIFASNLRSAKYAAACTGGTPVAVLRYTSSDGRTCYGCVSAITAVTASVPATGSCTNF